MSFLQKRWDFFYREFRGCGGRSGLSFKCLSSYPFPVKTTCATCYDISKLCVLQHFVILCFSKFAVHVTVHRDKFLL